MAHRRNVVTHALDIGLQCVVFVNGHRREHFLVFFAADFFLFVLGHQHQVRSTGGRVNGAAGGGECEAEKREKCEWASHRGLR